MPDLSFAALQLIIQSNAGETDGFSYSLTTTLTLGSADDYNRDRPTSQVYDSQCVQIETLRYEGETWDVSSWNGSSVLKAFGAQVPGTRKSLCSQPLVTCNSSMLSTVNVPFAAA